MPRFFLSASPNDGFFEITGDDARHISFSLRMRCGEHLVVCDGEGTDYECVIQTIDGQTVKAEVLEKRPTVTESPVKIRLYQSVPKGDKFDYIVQKAVELGVSEIVPVYSSRCIVKPDAKSEEKRLARLSKIAEEAAKQCGRGIIPKVLPHMRYADAVRAAYGSTFLCYEDEKSYSLKEYLHDFAEKGEKTLGFFVGPEGGYAKEEVLLASERGIPSAKLGNRILRSETASGFVLSCIAYALEL
ncbi:MAG: 16S rRNA (uracil(1498)-N(3))-methyltransferase [Clostridia bacterium]|nr:16S rRNA (uracil(1498)-N(3))-methyltransferase [Clostridia bacterium]MBP3555608.1 16S rRNA (uracil(1498)-N(3))-methyltransferase [Clostridia bacterium]MBQ8419460.1 16S rRNA (uracil(1498)-N(3))-methyltransferase [Clostridia bacterium]